MQHPKRLALPSVVAAAALVLTGCAQNTFESTPDDTVYCVDANNVIVDENECNTADANYHPHSGGSNPALWFMLGHFAGGMRPGTRLDPSLSTQRFSTTDSAARSAAGLSSTGIVRNGTSAATGKPAGLGKGSSSKGKPGGFGGGHSGG